MAWETIEQPGYFGKKRDELYSNWNRQFGEDKWRIAYQWGNLIVPRELGIQLYEDGYYEFFRNNPETLDWLTSKAIDVYDTSPTNTKAGFRYTHQETPNNHIHDVAIRRSVARLGKWFEGDHLMHVRWVDSEGYRINPGVVPFHRPDLIITGEIKDYGGKGTWWNPRTIEDFYQRNKVLQVEV
jgi:hypothetical protein